MSVHPTSSEQPTCDASPASGLKEPAKKDIAMRLVSAAENSSLCWKDHYEYIEYNVEHDPTANRGYTGGIVGFTSRTGDMLDVVERFKEILQTAPPVERKDTDVAELASGNELIRYICALKAVKDDKSPSKVGLGLEFEDAWRTSDRNGTYRVHFRKAQDLIRDKIYFNPAVEKAQDDELRTTLGQFIYYDAMVMHGSDPEMKEKISFDTIRADAMKKAKTPHEGGDETKYLHAFLDARRKAMLEEAGHKGNTDRVDTMQRVFLNQGNLELNLPLKFQVNDETFQIPS